VLTSARPRSHKYPARVKIVSAGEPLLHVFVVNTGLVQVKQNLVSRTDRQTNSSLQDCVVF
jgi:hypothetical protein